MKKHILFFLQFWMLIICLVSLVVFVFILPGAWRHIDDENQYIRKYIQTISIILYLSAFPFYYAKYQALRLLALLNKSNFDKKQALFMLMKIRNSYLMISTLALICLVPFFQIAEYEDAPGIILMNLFAITNTLAVVAASALAMLKLTEK